jgi:hypothetical protein
MNKIISRNEALKQELIESILKKMPEVERSILESIFKEMDKIDTTGGNFSNGILTAEQLLRFEDAINTGLKTGGYNKTAEVFINDLGKITINTSGILEAVGYSHQKLPLSKIEKKWKAQTAETLMNSGINESFKRPILQILDNAISYGESIDGAKKQLTEFIQSGADSSGKLKSYITQTARDSVSQLQGQQMQSLANETGYNTVLYVGGTQTDSRGQCWRWVRELNGKIPRDKLQEEIRNAYKFEKAKREFPMGHKWSGMMPNTTVDNFMAKRGGFNCTHTAVPSKKT